MPVETSAGLRHLSWLRCLSPSSLSPRGTTSYAKWNGTATRRSAGAAVCIASSPLHAFIRKPDLLATIHANLLTKETFQEYAGRDAVWGQPVWHRMPVKPGDLPETTRSYLGRLVPVARAVWLNDDKSTATLGRRSFTRPSMKSSPSQV